VAIVAVCKQGDDYPVLNPCGNCRQLVLDYAPEAMVIVNQGGEVVRALAHSLLPAAYTSDFDGE